MEEAACTLDIKCKFPLAKKKRLSLRGHGVPQQPSRNASSQKTLADIGAEGDLKISIQQVNFGSGTTGSNIEQFDDQDCTIITRNGNERIPLQEDTQLVSGISEGLQNDRDLITTVEQALLDGFCDAEEELPLDVLEEVLSQYDRPLAPCSKSDNSSGSFFDTKVVPQESAALREELEDTKYTYAESAIDRKHFRFEECDVSGRMVQGCKPGFGKANRSCSISGGSSGTQDAFDDSSAFRDDLFLCEDNKGASIAVLLGTHELSDPQLNETPCEISGSADLSFKNAFYAGGTDWSALHEVDEYGFPCASSPQLSSEHDCASIDAEKLMNVDSRIQCKIVRPETISEAVKSQITSLGPSFKEENNANLLSRSSKLKQGDLSSFLGFKRKSPVDAKVPQKKTHQQDIGTYFGLAPLAKQASTAASFFAKLRPRFPTPGRASIEDGQRTGNNGWKSNRETVKNCPFYKKMPGTPFTVDAFKFGAVEGCKAYFLTHFHSDHYGGLTRSWSHGPIFCTEITARLVSMHLGVDSHWLRPMKLGCVSIVEGVKVQFLEANHCPGAALILFQTSCGQLILHTGDFRACKSMQDYPELLGARITSLYLDTTYCNPKYNFPLQEDVINHVVKLTSAALSRNPKTLVTVGAYSIGKERVYLGIAKALSLRIYADKRRVRTLRALDWPDLTDRLCSDASSSRLHVLPISHLNATKLRAYMQSLHPTYSAVLAFRPTGWTYSEKVGSNLSELKPQRSGVVTIYGVPYSEHSSYSELQEFVKFLRPQKVLATVNVGRAAHRESMEAHFKKWLKC